MSHLRFCISNRVLWCLGGGVSLIIGFDFLFKYYKYYKWILKENDQMANKIKIKNSETAGKIPKPADLDRAELAINLPDKKIYTKDQTDSIIELGGGDGKPIVQQPADSAQNTVDIQNAADVGITIKGATGQTASLQKWQNNAGNDIANVNLKGIDGSFNDTGFTGQDLGDVSGSVNIDLTLGHNIYMNVVGPITDINVNNPKGYDGAIMNLFLTTDGSDIKWAPMVGGWFGSRPHEFPAGKHGIQFSLFKSTESKPNEECWWGQYRGSVIPDSIPFKMTVRTAKASDTFTLPFVRKFNYNCEIDWGDNTPLVQVTSYNDPNRIHTYAAAGNYQISISGVMETLSFNDAGDKLKVISIDGWGDTNLKSLRGAFDGCINLVSVAPGDIATTGDTSNVTDFGYAWYKCSGLTSFPLIDTSSGTSFSYAWRDCTGLTSFPLLDSSSGTDFGYAWYKCSGLTSFPSLDTSSGTNFYNTWRECTSLTSFPLLDTSSGNSFSYAWYKCSGLSGAFPAIDTSSGTNFQAAWFGCSGLTSFPAIDTSNGTNFFQTWQNCSGLTSFPLIDTSSGTNFGYAWYACSALTSFPLIVTSSGTDFSRAWQNCSGLTSFPLIDTSSGTNFGYAWYACSALTSFPLIDTSSGTDFSYAWDGCRGLTSFPLIDTSSGTNFRFAWYGCIGLTLFPAIDTSSGTNFASAWRDCSGLTLFPAIDTSSGTNFGSAWSGCTGLTSFPLIDTSSGTDFYQAWRNCWGLTGVFPNTGFAAGTNFYQAFHACNKITEMGAGVDFNGADNLAKSGCIETWNGCTNLTTFPPNAFDSCKSIDFLNAFLQTKLTAASKNNILVSIDKAGQSNGKLNMSGGDPLVGNGLTSWNNMKTTKGWTGSVS
jgi:hypothetical protein